MGINSQFSDVGFTQIQNFLKERTDLFTIFISELSKYLQLSLCGISPRNVLHSIIEIRRHGQRFTIKKWQ